MTTMSWHELSDLLADGSLEAMSKLGRTPADLAVYEAHIAEVKRTYSSVKDYMEISLLGAQAGEGTDAKVKSCGLPERSAEEGPLVLWRANGFPYAFDAGMSHHLVWSTRPLEAAHIERLIQQHLGPTYETQVFTNPPSLQSVNAIWHCHVISRLRK